MSLQVENLELGRHISVLYRYGRAYMEQLVEDMNIGSSQYSFLFYLYNHDGAIQDEISTFLSVDKTTTTRAIHKLEKLGYVTRVKDELDQRKNKIFLTEAGWALKVQLKKASKEWQNVLLKGLSESEIRNLGQLLNRLEENAVDSKEIRNNRR